MGISDRVKFNMFRKRNNEEANKRNRMIALKVVGIFLSVILISIIAKLSATSIYKENTIAKEIKAEKIQEENITDNNIAEAVQTTNDSSKLEEVAVENENLSEDKSLDEEFNITVLGDIMMGGEYFQNEDNNYMLPFKNVSEYTKKADYTICNLTTNISNLEKIEDPKSKYVVTKSIVNTFNALGVDGVNIASDHAIDFGTKQFNTTISILKEDKLNIIGLSKDIVYAENNGIRVAFIGINSIVIGNKSSYTSSGINMYDNAKNKALIIEAKKNADTVIVMPHYGKENTYEISDNMRYIAKGLIDAGADMVIGSHALGIYPIEEYKGKQIIYSSGYFMHDTYYEIGKQSAIFNISVNKKGQVTKTELVPVYIDKDKQVNLYKEKNKKDTEDYLKKLYVNKTFSNYEIKKENYKILVNLKNI